MGVKTIVMTLRGEGNDISRHKIGTVNDFTKTQRGYISYEEDKSLGVHDSCVEFCYLLRREACNSCEWKRLGLVVSSLIGNRHLA